jgi:hypothetical protein
LNDGACCGADVYAEVVRQLPPNFVWQTFLSSAVIEFFVFREYSNLLRFFHAFKHRGKPDRYRKSFPGASSSFTSSGYFCDVSTTEDTDGSGGGFSSPKLQRSRNTGYISTAVRCSSFSPSAAMVLGEPRYQFRKSNSMKLALKEDEEGDEH